MTTNSLFQVISNNLKFDVLKYPQIKIHIRGITSLVLKSDQNSIYKMQYCWTPACRGTQEMVFFALLDITHDYKV